MAFHLEYLHYRRQYVKCGRNCSRCPTHGPYWYCYQHTQGRMKKTYIGKELPQAVTAEVRRLWPALADRLLNHVDS